ncbi:MAG: PEP-CTERM sorting domain-containing protein [Rhodocyclaceae bacterium]|nr:PEP-CTERM sorting domain-containing protein [Rhodocyclaceae bacterium]MCP5308624.1 PEP-CTERM sorting domain-containing protein [Zoogloeaceae bacterium]
MAAAPGTTVASSAGINYGIPAAVPEPESYAMLLAGLGLIGLVARRRK